MKTITSNALTFIDQTDSRKFEAHISSNLPQVQIYDQNNKTYSPDWSNTALNLQASIYLDSTDITANTNVTIEWYKNSISTATKIGNGKTLTINTNVLSTEPIITYICQAKYQNLTTSTRIDYTRVDSGINGSSGSSAPAVQAQYSIDGLTGWTATLNAATHKYVKYSYDGGKTWTTAIKMVGDDGTSVAIKGTATSVTAVSGTDYYTITYGGTVISTAALGDSYLYGGDLYVCSELRDGADYFINVGKIQGAKGNDGESSYVYIRYATSSSGANMTASPSNQTTYIGIHVSRATTAPTTASSYTWSKFVGDSAKSIILSGDSQVFKVGKSSAYTPTTINVTAQSINTSVTTWTYNINDGKGFVSAVPTGVSRNDNVVTITGSTLATDSIVIKASDGSVEDVFTVYKAFDGTNGNPGAPGTPASMAFLTNENVTFGANASGIITSATITTNVVAYSGATKTTPTIGTIYGLPTGMTAKIGTAINSEVPIVFTITNSNLGSTSNNNGSITIPVNGPVYTNLILTWSKVNSGAKGDKGDKGVSIKSTTVTYGTSDSASTLPVDTAWQSTIPTVAEGEYLWTRTIIDYTDDAIADTVTYTYAKQGTKGDTGSSGSSVTVSSIQYQEGVSATTTPTGTWSNSVVSVAEGKYLWTKTAFSDGKIAYGVAKQGVSGKDGVGINSTTVSYGSSDTSTVKPTVWYTDIPTVEEGKYLWTRTVTDYTDSSKADTVTYVYAKQGVKGDTGSSGTSVTVKSIKYQAGTSATTAPTGTWSDSVVAVAEGNYLWTQTTFSDGKIAYGVAKQGQKGDKGDQGVQGPKGNDGQQYYTWVKYADTPTSGMSNDPDGKTYIGLAYNKTTATESTTYSDYAWSLIRGATGAIGPKGDDGKQYYTWIKYADDASGSNMSDLPDGKLYIGLAYNKTTSTESNVASDYTWALFKGDKGDTGRGISKITEYYLATTAASGVTTATTGWTPAVQTIDTTKKYLWNYELITYTDNATSTTTPVIIGVFGNTGNTGKGIKSITEYYLASTASSGVTTSTSGWKNTMQTLTSTNKYLWNYELITYTDNSTATINPVIIGVYGDQGIQGIQGPKGNDAYTVMLTNESHIFAGDVSNAIAGSATTQVLAYNGSTAQTVTIVSVNSKTAATTDTDTGIAGLKFKCSALSGASPTITFTCTTSFVSKSGAIPIVLSVGGVSFTKMFTYSIAFKGTTGNPGNPGSPGSPGAPASLVDITPSALYFKSTTGKGGIFTPDYIYLYPRFQTVTYSKWEYSINGGTTWVSASGANGLAVGTYNSIDNTLRIAKTSTLYTDTITSISFRCVSSNSAVYDTVSIAKIYDVVDLQLGGRNLLLNSGTPVTNATYNIKTYDLAIKPTVGEQYTITIKGKLGDGKTSFSAYNSGGNVTLGALTRVGTSDLYQKTFNWTNGSREDLDISVFIYAMPNSVTTESTIEWIKLEKGNKATDWSPAPEDLNNITFQIYAPKGYLLTNELASLTLETFAYEGSIEIASGATFQWSHLIDDAWININGATDTTLTVAKADVLKSKSYRCVMTYKEKTYASTITVQDKTDTYNSIMCISSNTTNNDCYWVLHTVVYSDADEVDPLLGPISIGAPTDPVKDDYWYSVDTTNATVTLKKYDGTSWVNSTDAQSLSYSWNIMNDGSAKIPLGTAAKVKVISCHDFTNTATIMCEVSNINDGVLTQSSLSLTDASDPIVSDTEPTATVNGQIWIKRNANGTYLMFVWDENTQSWISSDMDSRSKVHTSKPSSYNAGDLWITASNNDYGGYYALATIYSPNIKYYVLSNGVYTLASTQPTSDAEVLASQYYRYITYLQGTLLQAKKSGTTYNASDWSPTLRYDNDFDDLKDRFEQLSQYVSISTDGLRMAARNENDELSPFTALFTSTDLSFYQNSEKLLILANNQLTAPRVVVEDALEVQGSISLGDLRIIIENNGSFSFAIKQ